MLDPSDVIFDEVLTYFFGPPSPGFNSPPSVPSAIFSDAPVSDLIFNE